MAEWNEVDYTLTIKGFDELGNEAAARKVYDDLRAISHCPEGLPFPEVVKSKNYEVSTVAIARFFGDSNFINMTPGAVVNDISQEGNTVKFKLINNYSDYDLPKEIAMTYGLCVKAEGEVFVGEGGVTVRYKNINRTYPYHNMSFGREFCKSAAPSPEEFRELLQEYRSNELRNGQSPRFAIGNAAIWGSLSFNMHKLAEQWREDMMNGMDYCPSPVNTNSVVVNDYIVKLAGILAENSFYQGPAIREGGLVQTWSMISDKQRQPYIEKAEQDILKIYALGYDAVRNDRGGVRMDEEKRSELIEAIARNEHNIWAAEMIEAGVRYGCEETVGPDGALLTHPSLVPFSDLSKEEKEIRLNDAAELVKTVEGLGVSIQESDRKSMKFSLDAKDVAFEIIYGGDRFDSEDIKSLLTGHMTGEQLDDFTKRLIYECRKFQPNVGDDFLCRMVKAFTDVEPVVGKRTPVESFFPASKKNEEAKKSVSKKSQITL